MKNADLIRNPFACDELIEIARRKYYRSDAPLVADEETGVVRPVNFIDPRGCHAVRITPKGDWEEVWWNPDGTFRPI